MQDAGLIGPCNCPGSAERSAATLAIERSFMTKEHSVCRTPIHVGEVIIARQDQDTRSIILAEQLVVTLMLNNNTEDNAKVYTDDHAGYRGLPNHEAAQNRRIEEESGRQK